MAIALVLCWAPFILLAILVQLALTSGTVPFPASLEDFRRDRLWVMLLIVGVMGPLCLLAAAYAQAMGALMHWLTEPVLNTSRPWTAEEVLARVRLIDVRDEDQARRIAAEIERMSETEREKLVALSREQLAVMRGDGP
jgi:hypothetical protein